jgi:hypothetical protein
VDWLIALAAVHLVATLMMAGLIWFVQVVHYPLFVRVGAEAFNVYEQHHVRRTTWVVAPLMLTELATAAGIWLAATTGPMWNLATGGLALLAVIWLSTACVQVPCHQQLSKLFSPRAVTRLVATNWIRTVAWSSRGLIALALFIEIVRPEPAS